MNSKNIVLSILGTTLDVVSKRRGKFEKRWERWRPNVSITQRAEVFPVDELHLLSAGKDMALAEEVSADINVVSPETHVAIHDVSFTSPWELEITYLQLRDFLSDFRFDPSANYFFHITTGSHIQQIVIFLLHESRLFPGKLLQTAPPKEGSTEPRHQIIDLDLSKYDAIAERFRKDHLEGEDFLKSGIQTRNPAFNRMIQQIELVAQRSIAPMLITGPTGAGKSHIARRIYELKKKRNLVSGDFVETNCATLVGDNAMSTLFGHKKGAFTGAVDKRDGLLKRADKGMVFLDEVGELGLDEQAMLLRAIEDKCFLPMGADLEEKSDFQLIAGANKDLRKEVREGRFREDLFARINLWTYRLPGLAERKQDVEPNIEYELDRFERNHGERVAFNKEARARYLEFALSPEALWPANFRDLNASIVRMATLADKGRIKTDHVDEELQRLRYLWSHAESPAMASSLSLDDFLAQYLDLEQLEHVDYIEKVQLKAVIEVCRNCRDGAEAGRTIYNASRLRKKQTNDSHRLRQYLAKYGLHFDSIRQVNSV
ncbi:RNA repair transcriptional activator RtcR [Hahella sp. NBU794]|uniref:RNA repair transcriptional activator RtcR n=1 Tax=Hahella sp. NBU794 TaxID=3422590 RepID=UPI003D6DFD67